MMVRDILLNVYTICIALVCLLLIVANLSELCFFYLWIAITHLSIAKFVSYWLSQSFISTSLSMVNNKT